MTATSPRRTRLDASRLLTAVSAVAVGAFGWLVAHTLTFWLLSHSHGGALSTTARHSHHYAATGTVIVGCLAAAAILSLLVTGSPMTSRKARGRSRWRNVAHWSSGLSTVAFLTAEVIEHALGGDGLPSAALLMLGAILHALVGVGTSLLWLRFADQVPTLLTRGGLTGVALPKTCPQDLQAQPPRCHERLWAHAIAGRAPPIATLA